MLGLVRKLTGVGEDGEPLTEPAFRGQFEKNFRECTWTPHPRYSVFTQYDQK